MVSVPPEENKLANQPSNHRRSSACRPIGIRDHQPGCVLVQYVHLGGQQSAGETQEELYLGFESKLGGMASCAVNQLHHGAFGA